MRAIEFTSKISENKILIPRKMQSELIARDNKKVRVIVFIEDSDVYDERTYPQTIESKFLKGY